MWRRFNRDDLGASNPLVSSSHAPFLRLAWSVYDQYPVYQYRDVGMEGRFFEVSEGARARFRYQPLVDTPHLFLEFARLVEARNGPEAVRLWIRRRGLLGLHENRDGGGPRELLNDIWTHACRARNLLAMYEAVLSHDMEKLRQVFDSETGSWSAGPGLIPYLSDELRIVDPELAPTDEDEQQRVWKHREQMRTLTGMSDVHYLKHDVNLDDVRDVDALGQVALRIVIVLVQEALASLVRPSFATLAPSTGETPGRWWEPELLTRSWVPVNLLGAMYLQFYWLMTSAGDLSRCKYCGQIISYASSIASGGQTRKPRNDKTFCNSRCRHNYHYQNRVKPARQGDNQSSEHPKA